MPTISTQSIGIVSAPLVTAPQVAQAARAAENGAKADTSKDQNRVRASKSATYVQSTESRSVQDESRTEGVFGEGADENEGEEHQGPNPKSPGRFSRTA